MRLPIRRCLESWDGWQAACSAGAIAATPAGSRPRCAALCSRCAGPRPWTLLPLLLALMSALPARSVRAEASLVQCQRWRRSSGLERIELGNAIGAAAYLTKQTRLAESDPQQPRLLYAQSDLQRTCDAWG